MADKIKLHIRPLALLDMLAFKNLVPLRKKMLRSAPDTRPDPDPPVNMLARRLHPVRQYLRIDEVIEETPDVRSYRLVPDPARGTSGLAVFRTGQYLSVKLIVDGVRLTRPYSIASSPREALDGFYTLTIKRSAFATGHIWEHWKVGTEVETSGPEGLFYHTRLRDVDQVCGIAGGSGITPFISMLRDFRDRGWPVVFTLFYGCNRICEIARHGELDALAKESGGRLRVIHVIANEAPAEGMEPGFITADCVRKHVDPAACTFFVCGPQAMYTFVAKELAGFGLAPKRMRFEVFGEIKNVAAMEGYPERVANSHVMTVLSQGKAIQVPALSRESVLTAMERAGLAPPSVCRSGQCGWCRTRLLAGEVFVPPDSDDRRGADRTFGVIHACASYPLSDLTVEAPVDAR